MQSAKNPTLAISTEYQQIPGLTCGEKRDVCSLITGNHLYGNHGKGRELKGTRIFKKSYTSQYTLHLW